MKIGTFVASLVFLSCFDVNESQHHNLLQVRMEVQLGTRGDNDVKRLVSAATVGRYYGNQMACSVRHMHGLCTPLRLTRMGYNTLMLFGFLRS